EKKRNRKLESSRNASDHSNIVYTPGRMILVTGAAGFIGSHVAKRLLERGDDVIGLDNLNSYYDPSLKEARLERLRKFDRFTFVRADLSDQQAIDDLFATRKPARVVHLAAQA